MTRREVDDVLREQFGVGAVLVLLRNGRVERSVAIEAINRFEDRPASLFKRVVRAVIETVLPN